MPRVHISPGRTTWVVLGAALIAGNALARGGVDLVTIALSCAASAAFLVFSPGSRGREPTIAVPILAFGLAAAAIVTALQLVPLPPGLVRFVSPAAARTFGETLGSIGLYPAWRPLSLDPGMTALELAKAVTLAAVAAASGIAAASERRRDELLRALAFSGVAIVALCFGAALAGRSPLLEPRLTFVNPNHLAGFLQLATWPALGFALRRRGPERVAWVLAFAFTASGIFLSLSRAGIAAFFIGCGIFAVLRIRATPLVRPTQPALSGPSAYRQATDADLSPSFAVKAGRRRSGRVVIAAGISASLAVAAWLSLGPVVKEMSTVGDEATTAAKLGLWPLTLRMIRDYPAAGIGRGAFEATFPSYKSEPVRRTFTHVENEWLQLPLELGAVAGLAIIALFAWAFLAAARRRDLSRPLAGALAGAGALVAHNLFDFSLEIPGVAIPFAVVLGLASRSMPRVTVQRRAVRPATAALFALAAAGLLVHRGHRLNRDGDAVAAAANADDAIALARDAVRWHPADYLPQMAAGVKLVSEGRCREAAPWLTRAMMQNPTAPEPHRALAACLASARQDALAKREYRLAFSYGDAGALAEAYAWYPDPRALLEIAPDTPDGLWAAGMLLRGSPADAAEVFSRAWEDFKDARALGQLALAKIALRDDEAALELARKLQEVAPQTVTGYVAAARALDALDRSDEAQKELELGAARLPGNFEVLTALGGRHLARQRYSQARATFEAIVAQEGPALARKRLLVARALQGQGRYQEALAEAQIARGLLPADSSVLVAFARIAETVGRYDDAIDALEIAAKQPSTEPGAHDAKLAELRAARDEQRIRRTVLGR